MSDKHICRVSLFIFLVLAILLCFNPVAQAETKSSAEAKAFAEAQTKVGTVEVTRSEQGAEYRRTLRSSLTEREEELPFEADSFYKFMPKVEVGNDLSGKVGLMESASEWSYTYKLFGKLPLEFSIESKYIGINNSTQVKLPAHLTALTTGVITTFPVPFVDNAYLRVGVHPSYLTDNWGVQSSAFRIPQEYVAIYEYNDKLTLMAGFVFAPDYQDKFWPVAGAIYKPNDKLSFNLVPPEPNITYALTDKWFLLGQGGFNYEEYEVDMNELRNVVLQYWGSYVGGGLMYKANKNIQASVTAGGAFARRLQYRDSLGKVNLNNGMYTEFRLDIMM